MGAWHGLGWVWWVLNTGPSELKRGTGWGIALDTGIIREFIPYDRDIHPTPRIRLPGKPPGDVVPCTQEV